MLALLTSITRCGTGFAFDDTQQILETSDQRFSNLPLIFTNSVGLLIPIVSSWLRWIPIIAPCSWLCSPLNYSIFGTTCLGLASGQCADPCGGDAVVFFVLRNLTEREWLAAIAPDCLAVIRRTAESVA